MTQFCASFTVSVASTYLSDDGGGEVNFIHFTSAFSHFAIVGRIDPGFGISVVVLNFMCKVDNTFCVTEVSYPLPVLKCLGLEA